MAQTKVKEGLIDATLGGGVTWDSTAKTSNFTAAAGSGYLVDTSSSAITVTLPSSPSFGDEIILIDYKGNAATNNITLGRNSLNIQGAASDYTVDTNNESVRLLYSGATQGWVITSDAGAGTVAAAPDLTVDYLVVAGGGGGACSNGGAGGGGGGFRSTLDGRGGGQASESSLSLSASTDYTVTVGAGGSSPTVGGAGASGNNGSNSVFNTITSIGGGGGAHETSTAKSGGSGGGGGTTFTNTVNAGGAAVTSPVIHGYAGGSGQFDGSTRRGGGGGGAGSTGYNYNQNGNGGSGLGAAISGSSVTYAGGGGGTGASGAGIGGSGGGGDAYSYSTTTKDGDTNTGGGGGGGQYNTTGGSGGSGIVIVRYPDYYDITVGSGLTTGTLNTSVGTDEKYTTFTGGTGTITFGAA